MSGLAEEIPRDLEPAVASQELVGIGAGAKEVDVHRGTVPVCTFLFLCLVG
jgi:hypothetical protein